MKRSAFLAAIGGIFGVAKAQQWRECVRDKRNELFCSTENKPALNNQCPVCGTMALPYKRPTYQEWEKCRGSVHSGIIACDTVNTPYGPTEQLIRCKRCNAAFFQDSEQ